MSLSVPVTGIPELDVVFEEWSSYILAMERRLAALQLSGGAAGCYIGTVQEGGIPAATDDDTPGVGQVMIRQVYGEYAIRDSGIVVPVLNIAQGSTGAIVEGKQIATMPVLNKPGHQLVILDPCPPT